MQVLKMPGFNFTRQDCMRKLSGYEFHAIDSEPNLAAHHAKLPFVFSLRDDQHL